MGNSVVRLITSRRGKYLIIAFWVVMIVVAAPLAGKLTGVEKNDARTWLPGSAESTRALEAQSAFASPNSLPAVVVYERPSGLTPADLQKITADAAQYGQIGDLDGKVVGPIPAADGTAAQVIVPFNLGDAGWDKASTVVEDIKQTAGNGANGLTFHVTGPAGNAADSAKAFEGIDSTLLLGTIGVVVIILLFTYRSPALWLLPVISAGVALTVAQAVIYLLAKHSGLVVNAQSAGILTVLVFGAGTDYALLLVARYREELRRHSDRHEAMAVALHRAGPAIIASASTVIAGMLCLTLAETNATRGLGPVAAIGIAVGLAVMLTLLPALLTSAGRWIFWPKRPSFGTTDPTAHGVWSKVGTAISRHARLTWIITTVVLGLLALGIFQLNATGLSNKDAFRGTPDSVAGETVVAQHFAAGSGSPVVIISSAGQADAVRAAVQQAGGIDPGSVTQPVVRQGTAYIQGTLTDPADSKAAFDTIDRVRDAVHGVPNGQALVGGTTAINLDVQRAAVTDRNLIIPVVLAVVFLILIGTVVLSFFSALGASALVFRHAFGFNGADTGLPLFVFVFLVALGIDYNIFLMTRVREESVRHGTRRGALVGLSATGGVITSAGLVLAGTFLVLSTLPLTAFAEIGFAVALGVLLDTVIVRSVLVTALNLDLGRHIWWPSKLAKVPDPPREGRSEELVAEL